MIYFDNAATTFPKPYCVRTAASRYFNSVGGNPGRGGHAFSVKAAEAVFSVREKAADMFGAQPENVVFTLNCTHALNAAIKGIAGKSGHFVVSPYEHNSVIRPLHSLTKSHPDVSYSVAQYSEDDESMAAAFERLIRSDTKAVVCTAGSNVTGRIMPIKRVGEICKRHGVCFIADCAQVCGVLPVNIKTDGINIMCTAGHKSLYGMTGTGMLVTDGKYEIATLMEGGSGSTSTDLEQPQFLPDRLEAGTLNTAGILTLGAGMDFVNKKGMDNTFFHESRLCDIFIDRMSRLKEVTIYRTDKEKYLPVVSFNIDGRSSAETSAYLSVNGFALRGGLHCAPSAHRIISTHESGTVRFAPSVFNTREETERLCDVLKKY